MPPLQRLLIAMVLLLFVGRDGYGQLDTVHYLPPFHAASEFGSHFLYLTTPSKDDIVIDIRLGNGTAVVDAYGNILDSVVISNSTPQRIDLGASLMAGADVPVLTSKGELNIPISHKGLILRSRQEFYVNYRVLEGLQAASLTSKGGNALGQDFRIGHIPASPLVNNPVTLQRSNFVSVMATEDGTEVVFSELDPDLSYEHSTGYTRSGGEVRVTLDRGDSYVMSAYYGTAWPAANAMGLLGGRVTSTDPVVVNCGSWLGSPFAFNNQDIGIDQIVPVEYTGEGYALVRGDGPAALETPIAVAYQDSTIVSINDLGPVDTLMAGEYRIIDNSYYTSEENIYVHANKAFYMYQSLAGANDNRTGGLNFIPPLGCSSEKSIDNIMDIDLINNTPFQGKLFIVAEAGKNVWINDNILPAGFLRPVTGNPDYVTIKSPNLSGLVDVRSDGAIQVGIFGRNNAAGWAGYFSGFKRAVSPGVAIDGQLLCSGHLAIERDENTQRLEWYRNGILFDSTSTFIRSAKPGSYFVIGYNEFCRAIEVDTSATIRVEPPVSYSIVHNSVPCGTSETGNISVNIDSGGYKPFEFRLEGQSAFSSRSQWDSLGAGIYEVAIRDSLGCLYRDTIEIEDENRFPVVVPDLPDTLTCDNMEVVLSATGSSFGPQYDYTWTMIDQSVVSDDTLARVSTPGRYYLEITNNVTGCSSIDSLYVDQDTIRPVIQTSSDGWLTCAIEQLELRVDHNLNNEDAFISWFGPFGSGLGDSTSLNLDVDEPGDYVVTVKDKANGCETSDVISVMIDTMKPYLEIEPPDTLTCVIKSLRIDAAYQHQRQVDIWWQTDTGRILSGGNTLDPLVDNPGGYMLILTDTVSGCSDSAIVQVHEDTRKPVFNLGPDLRLTCTDSLYTIRPTLEPCPECFHFWRTLSGQALNDTSLVQDIRENGEYEFTRINTVNGCETSDTLRITRAPEPWDMVIDQESGCDQLGWILVDSVYGGEGPYQYSVDGGQTFSKEALFEELPPGTYQIVIRDRNGCELGYGERVIIPRKIRIVSVEDLTLDLGDDGEFRVEVNLPDNQISEIIWTPDEDLSCSDCLNPRIKGIRDGVYKIYVEDIYGCSDSATLYLYVQRNVDVFIPNVFSPDGDNLNDGFTAFVKEGQAREIVSFQIFSRWGEMVFQTDHIPVNDPSVGWDGNFSDEEAMSGVYTYLMKILFIDDSVGMYSGDVTLMR